MSEQGSSSTSAAERLRAVRARIENACRRVGRDPEEVVLAAVSKTVSAERVLDLARAGQRIFGENRVQEARGKVEEVGKNWDGPPLTWLMIGHLQRNKVSAAVDLFDRLDSVDSFRLLRAVDGQGEKAGRRLDVLLQFNCSGEETKGGFEPGEVKELSSALKRAGALRPLGLMTIGPLTEDLEASRKAFALLRNLREELQTELGSELPVLSMGMSGDLEPAVEEGATLVRVGTALFGARD